MSAAYLVEAEVHGSWLTQRRPKASKKLEPVGLGEPKRMSCSRLVGV
jgi:hypothetical protein